MYFPTLSILRNYHQVDSFIINKLDSWLGTRRQAARKFLNPIQFSIDTDLDEELSILLFANCTNPRIDVLKQRYVAECPNCNKILGTYYSPQEVPFKLYCAECNSNVHLSFDDIIIWFELTRLPEMLPEESITGSTMQQGNNLGNGSSLRTSRITQISMARRLLEGFDERIRSS